MSLWRRCHILRFLRGQRLSCHSKEVLVRHFHHLTLGAQRCFKVWVLVVATELLLLQLIEGSVTTQPAHIRRCKLSFLLINFISCKLRCQVLDLLV